MKKHLFLLSLFLFSVAINAMENEAPIPANSNHTEFSQEVIERAKNTTIFEAIKNGDLAVVQYLIANGADVNKTNESGETPLSWAVYKNNIKLLKLLIKHGAQVNQTNKCGSTPLHWAPARIAVDWPGATRKGDNTGIQLLIESGAHIFIKNNNERTPLDQCSTNIYYISDPALQRFMLKIYAAKHSSKKQKKRMYTFIMGNRFGRDLPKLPDDKVYLICRNYLPEAEHTLNIRELIQESVKDSEKQNALLALFPEVTNQDDDAHTNE